MYTLTTVTQPTADTKHPLLLLQSDHGDRYLFGKLAEGAQRSITENKIRISKLENIFLTGQLDWASIGGLPGLILTIADQGKDKLILNYGNKLINYVVSTWRYFVFRFGIHLSSNILENNQIFKDKLINVKSFVISASNKTNEEQFNETEENALNAIVSNMFPKHAPTAKYDPSSDPHLNVELPRINFEQTSTNYEITFNSIRGKFKIQEALKLGVPKGPLFAKLANGKSITLDDGSVVTPDQVLERERHFPKLLVLDIPNDSYVDSFIDEFNSYDSSELGTVYYFLDGSITINDKLITFMEIFNNNKQVKHIVSHPNISPNNLAFVGSAITILKLKALQLNNYNIPRTNNLLSKDFYECFDKTVPDGTSMIQSQEDHISTSIAKSDVHILERNTTVTIEPFTEDKDGAKQYNCNVTKPQEKENYWEELYNRHIKPLNIPTVSYGTLIKDQLNVDNFNNSVEKSQHVEVITFGTGSALPSKYRNVVSTLIKVPFIDGQKVTSQRNILFDAGENTIGQIDRMFSEIKKREIFEDLKLVYLSHLHADHHLGIMSILKEWYRYNKSNPNAKIYLVTPWQYNKFVKEWLLLEKPEILLRINYISCEHLINDRYVKQETKSIHVEEYIKFMDDELQDLDNDGKKKDQVAIRSLKKRKLELDNTSSFRNIKMIHEMYEDLNLKLFQTCRAIHCNWAYSNSITFKISNSKNFKISYSGDTRPNIHKFAKEIGSNSNLLIHEATLDNNLVEDAIKKRHCTINEAISVSNAMNVEKLLLTHFSQRYPKIPQLDNNIKIKAKEYCFAFDGMILDFEKMDEQKLILPLLSDVFVEEANAENNKEEIL